MASSLVRAAVTGAACGGGHRQDLDQGRGAGDGTGCSGRFQKFEELGKLGVETVHFGTGLWQRYSSGPAARTRISQLRQCREMRSRGPVCLMRGVNGAFWEGADSSESPANVHFSSQNETSEKEGSVLLSLIREIEPLDISLISKDASPDSTSAMKRTISGMLGLLPSDQFHVTIETPPDHLARLLVSSMMTGYTLRNAEYRLSLQRNLDSLDEKFDDSQAETIVPAQGNADAFHCDDGLHPPEVDSGDSNPEQEFPFADELGGVSSETASYILQLQAKLSAASKELKECKNALSSLELMRQEKNDLLDYLRSLKPEKVAELSQPSPEVHEVVEQVVAGILEKMIPKVDPSVPPFGTTSTLTTSWEDNGSPDVIGNVPLQFQSSAVALTSSRDYLARLLFCHWCLRTLQVVPSGFQDGVVTPFVSRNWCTLLGYHMRGLEYRLELSRTLSLSVEAVLDVEDDRQDSQEGLSL